MRLLNIIYTPLLIFLLLDGQTNELKHKEEYKYVFQSKSKSMTQTLSYIVTDKKKISFELARKKGNNKEIIKGLALLREDFDGETIVDASGNGHFVSEYNHVLKDCTIILRIDDEEHAVAQVLSRNCTNDKYSKISRDVMYRFKK